MQKHGKQDSEKWFIELLNDFDIPLGTECKYENIKKYFMWCAEIERKKI